MFKFAVYALLGMLLLHTAAHAQSTVKGKVTELHTDIKLSGITVENQTQKIKTQTGPMGDYSIKASKGDLLCFYGLNYVPDTVYLINTKILNVQLVLRTNELKEVKVTQSELNTTGWVSPAEKGILGSQTFFYKPGGGLKMNLFTSHADEKKRKKLEQLEERGEIEQQIARVFSPANLKEYVPLTGQEMTNFIIAYSPSLEVYQSEKFNFADYVNNSYKAFLKIAEDKRKSPTYFQLNGGAGNN
jgi:hypothetical protein